MYNEDQTKVLQQKSVDFLNAANSITENNIEQLRNVLRFHEYRYYVQNNPLISDVEYDVLYKVLEKIEATNQSLITKDSPTQRVGNGLVNNFAKAEHLVPMLSLENSYDADDLIDWDRKAKELSGLNEVEYCVEPKFDGASISLIYENNMLVRGTTRGDGVVGDDITPNTMQIKSIPLSANFMEYGINQIEVRGEVMLNKKNFKAYNDKQIEEGNPPLANPRNAAAGSLRIKDTAEVGRRKLEAFLYHVSYVTPLPPKGGILDSTNSSNFSKQLSTHSNMLEMLWSLGFKSPKKEMKVVKGIQAVIDYVNEFEKSRDNLDFEIDGMVIKVNNLQLQDKLGMTSHHPRWAIAYKFKARQATSKLIGIEFQVGRTGAVTPVAKIEAVAVGGVTVSSISVHNEEYIIEKDLQLGDSILIERSGDVIPQIVKSFAELRSGTEQKIIFPTHCPVCEHILIKPAEEAVWRCSNMNCKAQVVERIIHFVSKDALDIRSFGDANVRKFYDMGILQTLADVYQLPWDKLKGLEGFGEKSIANLQTAIENSKTQPLNRIIYGLGIRYVGETTAKTLANAVSHLKDFTTYTEEELKQLDDVGIKVAKSICAFFSSAENIELIDKLEQLGLHLKNEKKTTTTNGNLTGFTFLFTGTLSRLKRSDGEAMVEANGGKLLSGVSSKLSYLIVGEDAGSKLEKAKKLGTITILNEEEFLKMLSS